MGDWKLGQLYISRNVGGRNECVCVCVCLQTVELEMDQCHSAVLFPYLFDGCDECWCSGSGMWFLFGECVDENV